MTYRTHITSGLLAGGLVLMQQPDPQITLLSATFIGSLLPDIDKSTSFIGRKTKGLSFLIEKIFGHRKITHSFLGMFLFSLIIYSFLSVNNLDIQLLLYFNIGYLSHILTDLLTKSGVPLLYPYKKRYKIPLFKTGSLMENITRYSMYFFIFKLIKNILLIS